MLNHRLWRRRVMMVVFGQFRMWFTAVAQALYASSPTAPSAISRLSLRFHLGGGPQTASSSAV
jgi:hypothetical protein